MGSYVNPGNQAFAEILRSSYVDKTGLISRINSTLETTRKLTCISRPRRFGKSFATKMLCAYYDYTCDSRELFDSLNIAKEPRYLDYINKYIVIYLDMSSFTSAKRMERNPLDHLSTVIQESVRKELLASYPYLDESESLRDGLLHCVKDEGRKIIFIIDEWDAPIRETSDPEIHSAYLNLLRNWFKNNNFTPQVVAGAYMTGILPIKKDGTQSSVSDFMEYPILYPGGFAPFTGLTESEVLALCAQYGCDFQEVKDWYDGYHFPDCESIYNPYSVMQAMHNRQYRSYWQKTSAAESLMTYIELDFDGLQDIVARLLTDEEIEVNVNSFGNDFVSFQSRDDVLTLLIHLGYLTYNEDDRTVRIPNREVRMEFENILKAKVNNANWVRLIARSRQLLKDVIEENEAGFSSSDSCR